MKLHIPSLGDKLELLSDWTFWLHYECRNESLFEYLGNTASWVPQTYKGHYTDDYPTKIVNGTKLYLVPNRYLVWGNHKPIQVSLPKGTQLTIDRIYIRKGGADFNSVTFNLPKPKDCKVKGRVRFWAKLEDVNEMCVKFIDKNPKT